MCNVTSFSFTDNLFADNLLIYGVVVKILDVKELSLPGLKVLKFAKFKDERGYFCESFRMADVNKIEGFKNFNFQQSNESFSKKNVIRGLHFQWSPKMGKLIRTVSGHMVDIALDIRRGSPTFGKVIFFNMQQKASDDFGQWIWLPPGLAHGNFFLEDTLIEYFCTGQYNPDSERGISVFSKDLDFSLTDKYLMNEFKKIKRTGAVVSDKDRGGIGLADWQKDPNFSKFTYQ